MNREQAEHILDAYVHIKICEFDKIYKPDWLPSDASAALREVILDAMTEYKVKPNYPSITYPYTYVNGTPKVTYTGTDPVFNTTTGVKVISNE